MATVQEVVKDSVSRIVAFESGPAVSIEAAAPEGMIQNLIDQMIENLSNVDPDEAVEIMAKIEEAVAAFTAGNWLGGMLALAAAFRLYRKAIKD